MKPNEWCVLWSCLMKTRIRTVMLLCCASSYDLAYVSLRVWWPKSMGEKSQCLRKSVVAWSFIFSSFEHISHQTLLKEHVIIMTLYAFLSGKASFGLLYCVAKSYVPLSHTPTSQIQARLRSVKVGADTNMPAVDSAQPHL